MPCKDSTKEEYDKQEKKISHKKCVKYVEKHKKNGCTEVGKAVILHVE